MTAEHVQLRINKQNEKHAGPGAVQCMISLSLTTWPTIVYKVLNAKLPNIADIHDRLALSCDKLCLPFLVKDVGTKNALFK